MSDCVKKARLLRRSEIVLVLFLEEICQAAQPLLALTGTGGKTPLASLKSKLYLAAKAGTIIKMNNTFVSAETCRET